MEESMTFSIFFSYDVMMIQETFHHVKTVLPNFPLEYHVFQKPGKMRNKNSRKKGRAAGGLLLFVKKSSVVGVPQIVAITSNYIALVSIFKGVREPVFLINVYRASCSSPIHDKDFIGFMSRVAYESHLNNIVIGGDFNSPFGSAKMLCYDDYEFDVSDLCPLHSIDTKLSETGIEIMSTLAGTGFKICYGKSGY
jgi:hypothetical protein